ncbi:MAG: polysaccharide biosynthesis C-terminal domain-containing protein [Oscillospiraceae bacterium]|nr:polysaccharide biosynthesis C-terminal domain-containing protein [Oscillospiraceae bacterium]
MKKQSVLRGSVWLIGSALAAKILGAVFRIPLTAMLGGSGMGYFSCAYGLFLPIFALSVTGINTAVSAVTAQALARHDTDAAIRAKQLSLRMFGIVGAAAAAGLFLLAGPLCGGLLHDPQAAPAVRMLAPAVFFCCINAVLRGGYEGHQNMMPTAVSQVTEGIGRVVFGLMLCGAALHLPDGSMPADIEPAACGAAAAILGVTLSTVIGTLTLLIFPAPQNHDTMNPVFQPQSDRQLRLSVLRVLLPVAAASLVTNLTTLIDLAAGMRLLAGSASADARADANFRFGAYSGLAVTVFNLVPAVTNMLGKGVFPAFASSYAQHRTDETAHHAQTVMLRTAFLAVPAGIGVTVLAFPILRFLFPSRPAETAAAAQPLMLLGIAVIFAALSFPIFSMLQASGHAADTVTVMLTGAAVKLGCNLLLIPRLDLNGLALSTLLCYSVILLLAYRKFRRKTGTALHLSRPLLGIVFSSVLCVVTARAVYDEMSGFVSQRPALLIGIAAGGVVYLIWSGLLRTVAFHDTTAE